MPMPCRFLIPFLCAAVLTTGAPDAAPAAVTTQNAPVADYRSFVARLFSKPALAEFLTKADALIDAADPVEGDGRAAQMETSAGIMVDFSLIQSELATMYSLTLSRQGQEFHYSDAVKLAALFGDRAGLSHPIVVTEGEKPVYYCQWLIKPTDWKKYRKLMLEARADSRKVKDPFAALETAVNRELDARAAPRKAK